jgi:2-polyprenyl-3-methyl-5-hydroxy-6-metoxy-1,4-benzoquinol methylase
VDALTTATPMESFLEQARALLDMGVATYGLPQSGPLYDNNLKYLIDPNLHDFRLAELPAVTGQADITSRSLSMLDLGCGPGTLVYKAMRDGHNAYGIDLSEEKIELGRRWVDALGYPASWKQRLSIEDGGNLPFEDQSFDVVTSYHVLEHVADLPSVLYEAVRVTKRGGWLQLCAPDYRMSYDTHYCMPWPRFMPRAQAEQWCRAMGRPTAGIGSFFYVTAPQVVALLTALGCRVQTAIYREHRDSRVHPSSGAIAADPVIFRSDRDVNVFAQEIQRLDACGQLPNIYKTCLEFTIAAQRL